MKSEVIQNVEQRGQGKELIFFYIKMKMKMTMTMTRKREKANGGHPNNLESMHVIEKKRYKVPFYRNFKKRILALYLYTIYILYLITMMKLEAEGGGIAMLHSFPSHFILSISVYAYFDVFIRQNESHTIKAMEFIMNFIEEKLNEREPGARDCGVIYR
jgi:hypothetical protein